jgi:hypothetical protein
MFFVMAFMTQGLFFLTAQALPIPSSVNVLPSGSSI